jgi:hypothetical protein
MPRLFKKSAVRQPALNQPKLAHFERCRCRLSLPADPKMSHSMLLVSAFLLRIVEM